jgi:ubiquinone/menaquinone biosynthesis C-methylase UbiE
MLVKQLLDDVRTRHSRCIRGVMESREIDPERFDATAETYLGWALRARGANAMPILVDAFAQFSTDVVLAQARYEAEGRYENSSFEECVRNVYSQNHMADYLWGVYLTNFLWAHHFEIMRFYQDRFLHRLTRKPAIVEVAPGHGGWGLWALHVRGDATLRGYDISPSSIAIARSLAAASGAADRAHYDERNALDLEQLDGGAADACVCGFLLEHLEQPARLIEVIHHLLRPKGYAFITGALTAAQTDHIYEFRRESELVRLCEDNGLRVCETLSDAPRRTLAGAQFLPRSMAIIAQKRTTETW